MNDSVEKQNINIFNYKNKKYILMYFCISDVETPGVFNVKQNQICGFLMSSTFK